MEILKRAQEESDRHPKNRSRKTIDRKLDKAARELANSLNAVSLGPEPSPAPDPRKVKLDSKSRIILSQLKKHLQRGIDDPEVSKSDAFTEIWGEKLRKLEEAMFSGLKSKVGEDEVESFEQGEEAHDGHG